MFKVSSVLNKHRMGRPARVKSRRNLDVKVVDYWGTEIKADSVLAYPQRRGSTVYMNHITVTQVRPNLIKGYNTAGRSITLKKNFNSAIVKHVS